MRIFFALLTVLILSIPASAKAQDYKTLLDIPEGATLVSLSATERVEVEQDMLVANLVYQAENKDAKTLQNEINQKMKKAVDAAKKIQSVKVSTQQYYVHEYDLNRGKDRTRRNMIWRGRQGLQVKGKEADDLLELVGKMQDIGLTMQGLNYTLSPEKLEETRNSLLEAALEKLMTKASRTAKAIGKTKTDMLQINVDMGGGHHQPVMRSMAMADGMAKMEMAAPVATPGESNISLTVSAQALLK